MTTVWITRAQPGAEATAERVRAMGFEAVVAPLLTVRAIGAGEIDLAGVGALAFTSANGARAFAARSAERHLPVFAVGEGTAEAARAAGFAEVTSTDGDVARLAAGISAARGAFTGLVLHPGAAEPAGDLAGVLFRAGVAARALAIYETVAAEVPADLIGEPPRIGAVLVHSPKAARALAEILKASQAPHLRVFCLSDAVAEPLKALPLAQLTAAPLPSEAALLSLLMDLRF